MAIMEAKEKKELLATLRKRTKNAIEGDEEQRREGMSDMKFATVPGYQWDNNQKKERGKRPCYEFNKIRVTGKRIINSMRDNRPAPKIRGTEGGDKKIAEIYEGLIRNIVARGGDSIMDYAAEYQVFAGMGAWRVDIEENDYSFNADIELKAIPNPFCLFRDPSSRDILGRDSNYWILTEKIPKEEFEALYPNTEKVSFESHEFDDDEEWEGDEEVRVVEYWYKEVIDKEIWQLEDGKVVDSESDEALGIPEELIVRRKTVKTNCIYSCVASGSAILEGPVKWKSKYFPFIQVFGEYYVVDGKIYWNGITRFAKDPQRSYNVSRTAITETIAMAPQAKFWATPTQAEGHLNKWQEAHVKNIPVMLFNPDPENPGPPQRMGGADIPIALIQESQIAAEEINMVTGIYQSDYGAPNPAKSGRQELARQAAGNLATFNYQDNLAMGVEWMCTILIDLIPNVYDSERELRILGADGAEDYVQINQIVTDPNTGRPVRINDLSAGKYDVVVTVGPNFSTKRQEAAETYQAMLQSSPDVFPLVGDLVFKSMDLPYSEEIAERLRVMLPPQIQTMLNQDKDIPPEVQQMMVQAQQAMEQVEMRMAEVEEEAQQAEVGKADLEKEVARLRTEQANFEAQVERELGKMAKVEAQLIKRQADLTVLEGDLKREADSETERVNMNNEVANQMQGAVQAIQEMARQFNAEALQALDAMKANERPMISRIIQKRENGELIAVPEYDRSLS